VLRELDAITAAAEALPFASFAQRLQGIDDVLAGLCAKTSAHRQRLPAGHRQARRTD
jgi:hypothetical protein